MKKGKLITFHILLILAMVNAIIINFSSGMAEFSFTLNYFKTLILGLSTFFILWLIGMFTTLSYLVPKGLHKKNYLRINLIILFILVIIQIVLRIMEINAGVFCSICWLQLILYICLLVVTIIILRNLQKLIRQLFSR